MQLQHKFSFEYTSAGSYHADGAIGSNHTALCGAARCSGLGFGTRHSKNGHFTYQNNIFSLMPTVEKDGSGAFRVSADAGPHQNAMVPEFTYTVFGEDVRCAGVNPDMSCEAAKDKLAAAGALSADTLSKCTHSNKCQFIAPDNSNTDPNKEQPLTCEGHSCPQGQQCRIVQEGDTPTLKCDMPEVPDKKCPDGTQLGCEAGHSPCKYNEFT